jgi:hypothetical protein
MVKLWESKLVSKSKMVIVDIVYLEGPLDLKLPRLNIRSGSLLISMLGES